MNELIFTCPEAGYELYNELSKYFKVEIIDSDTGTMGILDALKILVEPISKAVDTIGNIIIALINKNSCTIIVRNGDREVSFDGKIRNLSNEDVMNLLSKVVEE